MTSSHFDVQPELTGETLHVRPLVAADHEGLYRAASDPAVWAGHPAKDRHRREIFDPYFQFLLENRSLVVEDRASSDIIGASRFYPLSPPDPDAIAIGYTFLATAYWGGVANRELKALMLGHAFAAVSNVWFHIAPDNVRSQKATAKLGAVFVREEVLEISRKSTRMLSYVLSRDVWET